MKNSVYPAPRGFDEVAYDLLLQYRVEHLLPHLDDIVSRCKAAVGMELEPWRIVDERHYGEEAWYQTHEYVRYEVDCLAVVSVRLVPDWLGVFATLGDVPVPTGGTEQSRLQDWLGLHVQAWWDRERTRVEKDVLRLIRRHMQKNVSADVIVIPSALSLFLGRPKYLYGRQVVAEDRGVLRVESVSEVGVFTQWVPPEKEKA